MSKHDFPAEEFATRQSRTRAAIAEAGLDWLIAIHPVSIHWLIGADGKSYQAFQCLPISARPGPLVMFTRESERCEFEADTLAECVEKAQRSINENHIAAEVIVADNGSTDGSQAIATRLGARIVHVPERGYGSALMGGIAAARGRFILMGDADGSYDFERLQRATDDIVRTANASPEGAPSEMPSANVWKAAASACRATGWPASRWSAYITR